MSMKLTIVVEFPNDLSERAQQELKQAVQDLKEAIYLGKVVKAELVKD